MLRKLAVCAFVLSTGCATIFSSKDPRHFYLFPAENAPGLTVTDNGEPIAVTSFQGKPPTIAAIEDLQREINEANAQLGKPPETLTTPAGNASYVVMLDPHKSHHLVCTSNGKSWSVDVPTTFGAGWLILDLFTTGPIGIVVDAITGDWSTIDKEMTIIPALTTGAIPGSTS